MPRSKRRKGVQPHRMRHARESVKPLRDQIARDRQAYEAECRARGEIPAPPKRLLRQAKARAQIQESVSPKLNPPTDMAPNG